MSEHEKKASEEETAVSEDAVKDLDVSKEEGDEVKGGGIRWGGRPQEERSS